MSSTRWSCGTCGQEYLYIDHPPLHGGPKTRGLDRRYGIVYSCWRNPKCPTHNRVPRWGRVILVAAGAPNPAQPDQPDLENIKAIIAAKKQRRTTG